MPPMDVAPPSASVVEPEVETPAPGSEHEVDEVNGTGGSLPADRGRANAAIGWGGLATAPPPVTVRKIRKDPPSAARPGG